ncbi:MAG: iron chaperone, partial [Acidimicrobiia bacterium]
ARRSAHPVTAVPGQQIKKPAPKRFASIDQYIASFPPDVQVVLEEVRRSIRRAAPGTEETISYQIPTFTLRGRYVVYFAGWKNHLSVYPIPEVDQKLEQEMSPYRAGKGTLRFPLSEPIPYELIERVVGRLIKQKM